MLRQIKQLGADTAVYGISTILGRFLNFILVPLYTHYLDPGQYGIVSYVYSLIAFAYVVYLYGMETAFLKYATTEEQGTKKQSFSTAMISLTGTSLVISILLAAFAPMLLTAFKLPANQPSIIYYTAGILLCDTLCAIPFASLRLERRAKLFAMLKLANILINVGMNILLVAKLHKGIEGIFISGFVSSAATVLLVLPTIKRNLILELKGILWKALMKYGLPSVPAGLAGMVLQVVDRPILKALTNDATVGIYQANYRLGIFMMLIVSMFDYAWKPFIFSLAMERDAKEIFSRVLTYFTLLMASVFLFLTFFIDNIVRINLFGFTLINERYWSGLDIVPIVLLGYLFLGMATTMSAGIYIEKKTQYNPPITMAAAAVNIAVNLFLIPLIGFPGAAWATLIAYFVMAVMTYIMTQRIYPMKYEWGRLLKIGIALAIVVVTEAAVLASAFDILFKILLVIVFFLLLGIMQFFKPGEMAMLKGMVRKFR